MNASFNTTIAFVLAREGGKVDDPQDPGGRTNRGITQRTLDEFRAKHPELGFPADVFDLTDDQAITIYRLEYWNALEADALPAGIDLFQMDTCVNCGTGDAIRWLQLALNVPADGNLGPMTRAALTQSSGLETQLLRELMARRLYHYMLQDKTDDRFGLGWARRSVLAYEAAQRLRGV